MVSGESIGWQGLAPNSCEITKPCGDGHVISVGNSQGTTFGNLDSGSMSGRVNNTHARSGLAFIAHPNAVCYGLSANSLASIISNSSPEGIAIDSVGSNAETKWAEVMNRLGRPVWGYAEDDYHPNIGSRDNLARTWVAVPGEPGEWWGNIKEKLRSGNYYSYWTNGAEWPGGLTPPRLAVTTESGDSGRPRIVIGLSGMNLNSANRLEIIGKDGWGLAAVQNPGNTTYAYQCTGYEGSVRVRVSLRYSFGTLNISSQPIRIYKTGAYAPYKASSAPRTNDTSPQLQIRYLQPDEMPQAIPAAGYVGDAFDVTTDTGTVPPSATLQLSFDGEDTSAIGGTQYLAICYYNEQPGAWVKVGGAVDPATATIEALITQLGKYCISADLPVDTTAPQVWIENPPYAASVASDTTVKATVNDDLGAWRVRFYMHDHLLAEDADALDFWTADLKVSDYCTGDWTLKAEAEDLAGNVGTTQIPIYIVSSTPPPTVTVSSPGAGNVLSGIVTATGTCGDDVAVASVALSIGDTALGFADIDSAVWTCQIDTTYLADGNRTLTATVEDYPGNSASATVPVVVNNSAATSPIGNVKNASDGSAIRFASAVVVADKSIVGDGFYAEAINRTSGVKVLSSAGIHVGDSVSVVGTKSTIGHESVVQAQDVAVISTGNTLPKPLASYATKLLLAPDSVGKIVKLWGTIGVKDTATPPAWFIFNDQTGVPVKCKLASGVTFDPGWTLVAVTGVVSIEDISGQPRINLLVTNSADIQPLVGI